jgi:hypothetical protein
MSLPDWKQLRKTARKNKIQLSSEDNYFQIAEEFVILQKVFVPQTTLDNISLWMDMIVYPLYVFINFFFSEFSALNMISLIKTYQLWMDWCRFRTLGNQVRSWTNIVRSMGGPFISSNDAQYHVFVYADGMERLRESLKPKYKVKNVKKDKERR